MTRAQVLIRGGLCSLVLYGALATSWMLFTTKRADVATSHWIMSPAGYLVLVAVASIVTCLTIVQSMRKQGKPALVALRTTAVVTTFFCSIDIYRHAIAAEISPPSLGPFDLSEVIILSIVAYWFIFILCFLAMFVLLALVEPRTQAPDRSQPKCGRHDEASERGIDS